MGGIILLFLFISGLGAPSAKAEGDTLPLPKQVWSFSGPTGAFRQDSLQRGYQVYKEVCSACHGVKHISYANLKDIGLSKEAVKALAASYEYADTNDEGEPIKRKGIPTDKIISPFANDKAARAANNGALPPDLSLIIKARAGGADYVRALLTGYSPAPKDFPMQDGMHYNPYFAGRQIAMPPPLTKGQVTFADGTPSSVDQMSRDVVSFLSWAAEPEMMQRKQTGIKVVFYLMIMTMVFYFSKRKVWKKLS
jgi:ubiquinol-cytochrome c reductase cytochrome c1 subunit